MSEAATTSGQPESESVRPSLTLENAAEINFDDPEQETVEAEAGQHSQSETDEVETGQESDEIEATGTDDDVETAEGEGEADEASTPEPADEATITVDGQQLTLGELKKGYFREADYTRQKQVVSKKEKDLEALSARVTNSVNVIADFLIRQIPEAPDPSLAMTKPAEFVQKKALHEAAVAQVNALLQQAGEVQDVAKTLTAEQRKELLAQENAELAKAFPATATSEGRKKFFDEAAVAARELGYSDDEIKTVADHRMFKMAHYARIGMQAEAAKAKAAKKVASAPPVAPQKRQPGVNASHAAKNREAMKRLTRTGSIHDALAVDFD